MDGRSAYAAFEALRPQELMGYSDFPLAPICAYDVLSPEDAASMFQRSTAYSVVDPSNGLFDASDSESKSLPGSLASSSVNPALTQAQHGDLLSSYGSSLRSQSDAALEGYGDLSENEAHASSADDKLSAYGSTALTATAGMLAVAEAEPAAPPVAGPKKSKYITEHVRDWNADFQKAVDMEPSPAKFLMLKSVAFDFVETAKLYGRIIISEARLPVSEKSIPPVAIGGVAGGEKFITQGILFKFAIDQPISPDKSAWMYGGAAPADHLAMKAASHELKGNLNIYHKSEESGLNLSLPLIALVDFRGYRLLASSIIPINKDTLVLGSADAGVTFHHSDQVLFDNVLRLCSSLRLGEHGLMVCSHYLPAVGREQVVIASPGDLEGHKGLDGRYYLLDVARLFPPEAPMPGNKRAIYYNLLRAEFLLKYKDGPLSSDAFSGWGSLDPKAPEYNQKVRDATVFLRTTVVKEVAAEIDRSYDLSRRTFHGNHTEFGEWLTRILHLHGVNLRYLGLVRHHSQHQNARKHILAEMIARVVKINVKRLQRQNVTKSGVTAHLSVLVDELNTLIGHRAQSPPFWYTDLKKMLRDKYGTEALSDDEMRPEHHLAIGLLLVGKDAAKILRTFTTDFTSRGVDPTVVDDMWESKDFYLRLMISRIESLLGIHLRADVRFDGTPPRAVSSLLPSYVDPDNIRVKHSNIVDFYEGVMMDELGSRLCHDGSYVEGRELLKKALQSFLLALSAATASTSILLRIARLELKLAPLISTTSKKFMKIFSMFSLESTFSNLAKTHNQLRDMVAEHVKSRLGKVLLLRERAAERLRLAKAIFPQQAKVLGLTVSTMARQEDSKARVHFARAEALLELARSRPLSASVQTMYSSVRLFRKALKSPKAIMEFLPDCLACAEHLLRQVVGVLDRGPEGTWTEFTLAHFIKLQVAELMDPGSLVASRGILIALGMSLGRTDYSRWKQMRNGILENSQIAVTIDDEVALMWLFGVKAEKVLGLDRTSLDWFLAPWSAFFATWSTRFAYLIPTHPLVAARMRDVLGNQKRLRTPEWNFEGTFDLKTGFAPLVSCYSGAEEIDIDGTRFRGANDASNWEPALCHMTRIKTLKISSAPFPPEAAAMLPHYCSQLTLLSLYRPFSTADDYALHLTKLTNLTHLALGNVGVPDVVLEALLTSLPNLTSLSLKEIEYLSDDFGQVFINKGRKLASLSMDLMSAASNKTLDEIRQGLRKTTGCPHLTQLVLISAPYVDANALEYIGQISSLRALQLIHVVHPKVDGELVMLDCLRCSTLSALELTSLMIDGCDPLSDIDCEGLKALGPNLQSLEVHLCTKNVTSAALASLLQACTRLCSLKIRATTNLDAEAIAIAVGSLTRLTRLGFEISNNNVTLAGWNALAKLTGLRELCVPGHDKTFSFGAVSALTGLELLEICGAENAQRDDFLSLQYLTNMRVLNVSLTPFTDNYLFVIANMTKLTHLSLKMCPLLLDDCHILYELPRLQYLWLYNTELHNRAQNMLNAARFRLFNLRRSLSGKCLVDCLAHNIHMGDQAQVSKVHGEWR